MESSPVINEGDAFEAEPKNLKASIKIRNLTKSFRTNFEVKKAVDNISVNFYENQITGFLGKIKGSKYHLSDKVI